MPAAVKVDCERPRAERRRGPCASHVVNGISDLRGEIRFDYEDPEVWAAEKGRLAHAARLWFRANAVLTAAGYNVSLLLRWFGAVLRALLAVLLGAVLIAQPT